jgi:hypothetical protein
MTATFTGWMRRSATGAIALTLATALAGCSVPGHTAASAAVAMPSSLTPGQARGPRIVVRMHGYAVTAILSNTPEARQFAALLPLSVDLKDVWGQAKSGPLPRPLPSVEAARPVHRPAPGGIYFWPGTDVIAIYYDDLGQSVPDPGLVQLGVIETGLEALADAGRRFTVAIEPAAAPTL